MGFGNFQSFVMIPKCGLVENHRPSSSPVGWTFNDPDSPSGSLEPLRTPVTEHPVSARCLRCIVSCSALKGLARGGLSSSPREEVGSGR